MDFKLRKNSTLRKGLGQNGADFLVYALRGIERILPHVETIDWNINNSGEPSRVVWENNQRRRMKIILTIKTRRHLVVGNPSIDTIKHTITGFVRRKSIPTGVGKIARTLDTRENQICKEIIGSLNKLLNSSDKLDNQVWRALQSGFDEQVISAHLKDYHGVELNLENLFSALRRLAEQSYENKSLTFGCLIDCQDHSQPTSGAVFPQDFLALKKFRFFSDGYRTIYKISSPGRIIGFSSLTEINKQSHGESYFPEWCRDLATSSTGSKIGVALTRQGDVLVFDAGSLRFSYRYGIWQYWNHSHLVDLLQNAARSQRVPPKQINIVARTMYRNALDVSFRRSGGLFVLLQNTDDLHPLVHIGDAIEDPKRGRTEKEFDKALSSRKIQNLPRDVVVELASLDGAVVLNKKGEIMAYGAVLEPTSKGVISREEGSRTKAAVGSSNYGLALKISSDGEIIVYINGKKFLKV